MNCKNIIKQNLKNKYRFHTPGHSGQYIKGDENLISLNDITELSYSDNLLLSEEWIEKSEQFFAEFYNVKYCLYHTSGGTSSIFTAISSIAEEKKILLVNQFAHKSVYSIAKLFKLKVEIVSNDKNKEYNYKDIAGVLITSPDYFGNIDNLNLEKFKEKNIPLIIDASHGAHYIFNKKFPNLNLDKFDLIIMSLHKTLPCVTGSAVLLINNEKFYNKCFFNRLKYHTSSPNYLIINSIVKMINDFSINGKKYFDETLDIIDKIKFNSFDIVKTDDKSRLIIKSKYNPLSVAKYLEEKGFYAEMTYENLIVFIVTPFNAKYLSLLVEVLNQYQGEEFKEKINIPNLKLQNVEISSKYDIEFINLKNALGRISLTEIGIFPPGVPLIKSGDIFDNQAINFMENNLSNLFGLVKGKLAVLK